MPSKKNRKSTIVSTVPPLSCAASRLVPLIVGWEHCVIKNIFVVRRTIPRTKKPPLGLAQRRLYAVTLAGMIAPSAIDRQLIGRKLRNGAPLQQPETKRSVIFCRKLFRSLRHPVVSNLDLATSPWSKLSLGRALPVQCRTSPLSKYHPDELSP
jgi:hypothetical protein